MPQEGVNSGGASSSLTSTSPTSTTYSSETLADIAARVLHELNLSLHDLYDDDFYGFSLGQNDAFKIDEYENKDEDDEESEFEFAVICGNDESKIVTADEIFYDGKIKPIYYPVFNTNNNNNNVAYGLRNDIVLDSKTMSSERERVKDNVVYSEVMKTRENVNAVINFYSYNSGRKKTKGATKKKAMKSYLTYKHDLLAGFSLMMS
ncbi:hypothetical protein vseg_017072 [Gypsophila vaccaria]